MTENTSWLKIIPDSWLSVQFDNIMSSVSLTGRKIAQRDYMIVGELPVIDQGQEFIGGYTDRTDLQVLCSPPVVVFGDHTKVVKYIDFDFVAGADGLKVLQPSKEVNTKFLYYVLQAVPLPDKGYARHFQYLQKSQVPLPPLPEQHRIVNKIEELFTRLDAGVETMKKIQLQLKRYRQSVLKAAFEGKLTEEWRETHKDELEPASVLLEKIKAERKKDKKYKELPPVDTSDKPDLPVGWEWARINEIVDVGTGATPLRSKKEYYKGGTIPWVTSSALNQPFISQAEEKITELAILETNTKVFPSHSLLVAMYGEGKTRGKVSELLIDAATNQACAALIFSEISLCLKSFIKWFFQKNYDEIRELSSGGVQPNLNLSIIKSTSLPMPTFQEQRNIVEEIERRFSVVDKIEETVEHSLQQANRLRQSILKRAFEGKLVPQDFSDEPAEKLLERIKAGKEKSQLVKRKRRNSIGK